MSIVAALNAVRFEYQMIPYPHGVEAASLGAPRSLQTIFHRSILAEMRQQQAKFQFCSHNGYLPFVTQEASV
jgi:hypothetical protein